MKSTISPGGRAVEGREVGRVRGGREGVEGREGGRVREGEGGR